MNKWQRFKEGMKNLTPAQQLHGQLVGYIGTTLGLILAWVVMLFNRMWYFSVVMFFAIWLNVIAYIGAKQKYDSLCSMMDEIKEKPLEQTYTEVNVYENGGKENV